MLQCDKCKDHGLQFDASFAPEEFIYGFPQAPIWIIGLNPKARKGETIHTKSLEQLHNEFRTEAPKDKKYFSHFQKVSPRLFSLLGRADGVAHTDIVRCLADTFPGQVTLNCHPFLLAQLRRYHPKLLICNGRPVCEAIQALLKPPRTFNPDLDTSYVTEVEGYEVGVVLSGFLARMDNHAKRRLGVEIETYMQKLGCA